jgi:hypothetical protein
MLQEENQTESQNYEWACQALSPAGEACNTSTTCHCGVCKKWFCTVHVEDEVYRVLSVNAVTEDVDNATTHAR